MPLRAVIFDYGLTLVTFEYPTSALLEVMAAVRPWLGPRAPSPQWLLERVLHPLEEDLATFGHDSREIDYLAFYDRAWRRAGLELSSELLYRILDLEQRCWDTAVKLAPGAVEILAELRRRNTLTAIASNAPFPAEMMRRQLAGNGLLAATDACVFSSEVGWRKPAPAFYAAVLDRLRVTPAEALHVGDRVIEDHRGPTRAGMRAVICTQLSAEIPPANIPCIAELTDVLGLL